MAAHVEIKIANWKGRGAHHGRQYDLDCYPSHPGHLFSVVTSDLPAFCGRTVGMPCTCSATIGTNTLSPSRLGPAASAAWTPWRLWLSGWGACLPRTPHASDARPVKHA